MNARALLPLLGVGITLVWSACAREPHVVEGNQPPLPVLDAPERARVGERVLISIAASDDLEGIVADRQILFGDGSEPAVGFGEIEHTYEAAGVYLIEAYLKDDDGLPARARRRIVITDEAP